MTSCGGLFSAPTSLMKAPLAEGGLDGVDDALEKAIGADYSFAYPGAGEYRTSAVQYDIDGDSKNEVIVFYTLTSDTTQIRMNYLRQTEDGWISVNDVQLGGTGVDKVVFADLCGDSSSEVLVGCNMYNSKDKQLGIYSISDGILTLASLETYTDFAVCSLTGDKKPQVMLLTIGTKSVESADYSEETPVEKFANATLISLSTGTDGVTTHIGQVSLDSGITAFSTITEGKIGDKMNGLYIDAYKGSDVMITELVYYDKLLREAFYSESTGENVLTRRDSAITCRDIDSDGYIEIPSTCLFHGFETAAANDRCYYTIWRKFDGSVFTKAASGVLNTADGWFLNADENWLAGVTVERDTSTRTRIFYDWNYAENVRGDELFRISVFSRAKWDASEHGDYIALTTDSDRVYAALFNKETKSSNLPETQLVLDNFKTL